MGRPRKKIKDAFGRKQIRYIPVWKQALEAERAAKRRLEKYKANRQSFQKEKSDAVAHQLGLRVQELEKIIDQKNEEVKKYRFGSFIRRYRGVTTKTILCDRSEF